MKKHAIVLVTCLLLTGLAHAQDRNAFIGIGVGASIPTADFASTSGELEKGNGFAKTGALFDLQFGYKFTEVVGVMAMGRLQGNPFDEPGFGEGETVEADPWSTLSFMAGPFVSFPLGPENKVAFESRLLGGYSTTRFPEIEIGTGASKFTYPSEKASGFAYLVGLGLRFNPGETFTLGVHADYFSAKPEFDLDGLPGTSETYKQPVQNINLSLSFGIRFL